MYLFVQADQRLKQDHEDLLLLAHLQELYLFMKEDGLTLSQELNKSPPPYPHVAAESANVISLAAANEPALMQYVLDGSTWSSICLILDLLDTFNMRTTATTWNCAAKYQAVHSYFSCCTMHLDIVLTKMCRWTVQFGGYRNVLRRHQNIVTRWGFSQNGGPGSVVE